MLAITVELLHGTYRADPSGLAATGRAHEGEWPPAPIRLLAALTAAAGTNVEVEGLPSRRVATDGSELALLEAAGAPEIYASHGAGQVHHQRLQSRYVVKHAGTATKSQHLEYVGRVGMEVRPGFKVTPCVPQVTYAWDIDVPPSALAALRYRAARVGYLGCADSPARVSVATAAPKGEPTFRPAEHGALFVSVPQAGSVAAMDAHYRAWAGRDGGASVQRAQFPALRHVVRYEVAGAGESATPAPQPTLLCVRFADPEAAAGASISGRRVVAVTDAFKAAVLRLFQDHVDEPPPLLTGHGMAGSGYHLGYYLALPNVGAPQATGRIHGLGLCLPPGTDPTLVDACRGVLDRMDHLVGRGFQRVPCSLWAGDRRPWASNPGRWEQTSQVWATAFPAVYERRSNPLDVAEVNRWCRHAGIKTAVRDIRVSRVPILAGGVDLAPVEVNRVGRPGKPYAHLEIRFAEPVRGPVVVGGARQRGLGLCAPMRGGGLSGG